jgi:peroxiredoxin Q/BCP
MEHVISWIKNNIWFFIFFTWGIPLGLYRSRFRKLVYQTDSWTINILPYFWKETKALFGTMYPGNGEYLRFRNFYRFYLGVYTVLFGLWYYFR